MCIPDVYLAMVRQTADLLIAEYPQRRPHFSRRLDAIADRIASLNAECRAAAESLKLSDAPVLTSRHQSVFAEWLGLNVIATFSGRDTETAANINDAIRRSDPHTLRCIIANQQEGTQLARALADWFDAPVAVFSNFPAAAADDAHTPAFDDLVRDNLRRLAEAAQ
jgi:ABC-type Zn uptake system ZnuABC Zn-binding protein ZnuA